MDIIRFEWDENKNEISFEEAKTVFYDEEALVIDDPEHSQEEERYICHLPRFDGQKKV